MEEKQLLIDNEWRRAASGATMEIVNPATEEIIGTVASAGPDDLNAAVAAARAALDGPWGRLSARERGRLVRKLGERLLERADEVARLETLHNGKPISESRHIEIPAAAECFEYFGGWSDKVMGETIPVKGNYLTYTLREPLGVVAAIVPWNFPLLLAAWKVAPALACGNTVILKPASQTPLTAIALGEIAIEAGLPPGVLNVLTGPGSKLGQAIVEHPGIDKIAFTGDTNTGKGIMRGAADTLKKITLELGGKSPNIVLADADMEAAIRGATIGIFYGKGEVCAAGSRLLVDKSIKNEFVDKLAARTKKMVPGDPMDPKTRFGAVSSKKQMETVLRYIESGRAEGATLVAGGARADIGTGKGYFVQPTVFADVRPEMTISREEIFGPVLAAIEFGDIDEAVAVANASPYGLAAGIWTRDIKKAHHLARRLQAGTVWINTYNVYDTAAPFGGYKQSGFGREMSAHALEHYTQIKSVWVDLNL
ncbi:MAG: betaine-aldehyde dehydrogenase [Acidobacteria bacterium RIFCSPLOWO2_02_FULL_67_36]|nr:MAG: betaine-aldehyde dehydrogenase [Acidobacteria bacterium RIFCSPLOWO2_02_FULL_67_36]OFW21302.1 MAG: betaine-aldehyde dehydrogenase [Acidobacteria bacterium RIFCSPLOWO2_12_FULL_66_21]